MNYLNMVNDVLIRLREEQVDGFTDATKLRPYAALIAKFVNDAKRQVEDAYNWNALSETLTVTTAPDLFNYSLTDIGQRFRVFDVINSENNWFLSYETTNKMNDLFLNTTVQKGPPQRYNFNGVDANGDTQVDLWPIPDAIYNIYFNVIKPQDSLVSGSDVIKIPAEPVIFLAYAKALAERGEDAGISSSEAYALYKESLADHIAAEANRYPEEIIWTAY